MKKIYFIPVIMSAMVMSFAGCSRVVDEKDIKADLEMYDEVGILDKKEEIKEVVIEKRKTKKEERTDKVWCTVTTEKGGISYEKEAVLTYDLKKKEGWVLDEVELEDSDDWKMTPVRGVTEKEIVKLLNEEHVKVDGQNWKIRKSEVSGVEIVEQNTELEKKKDTVTVNLKLEAEVQEAEGQIDIEFEFDDGWALKEISQKKDLAASFRAQTALDIAEEKILADIVEKELVFDDQSSKKPKIPMKTEEISDFEIEKQVTAQKGARQKLECSFTLTKPLVVFDVTATLLYEYQKPEGWMLQTNEMEAKAVSVDLVGEWTGRYTDVPWDGNAALNITKMEEDGTITATYSYTPDKGENNSGSYNVSGKIDFQTLHLTLEAGEWVLKPERVKPFLKQNISADIDVQESMLIGSAQDGSIFKIKR